MDSEAPPLVPPRPFFIGARPPPSSYTFPFQAHPGNPDPLPSPSPYTYSRRRASLESLAANNAFQYQPDTDLPSSSSSSSLYRASAAAHIHPSPSQVFRAPFLSPTSRPTSSLFSWSPPPLPPTPPLPLTPSASNANLQLHRPPMPSTVLQRTQSKLKLEDEKHEPTPTDDPPTRRLLSRLITFACLALGAIGAAALCYTGIRDTKSRMLDESNLCLVLDSDFRSISALDDRYWVRDVGVGGLFADDPPSHAGTFHIATGDPKNLVFGPEGLSIVPTRTRDEVPDYWKEGEVFVVEGCTSVGVDNSDDGDDGGGSSNTTTSDTTSSNSTSTSSGDNTSNTTDTTTLFARAPPKPTTSASTNSSSTSNSTSSSSASQAQPTATGDGGGGGGGDPCRASTSAGQGRIIPPAMSARISTRGKVGIRYGRVEIKARVGRGDWLWPAIWMLPENNTYGSWPLSGEIDIMMSRGNPPSYPGQGVNYVRSALTFGLDRGLVPIAVGGSGLPTPLTHTLFGWYTLKRSTFAAAVHTYAFEWDERFLRFWVDGRVRSVLDVGVSRDANSGAGEDSNTSTSNEGGNDKGGFWGKGEGGGGFPQTAQNGSTGGVVVVRNPWAGGAPAAPFDQRFYLNVELAVGGTTGWFPDGEGGKPWYDASRTAMRDFAGAEDKWYATWPAKEDERAFKIESVKMWNKGKC